uniref:DDE Tnp4 domain-containing protein n=1 Tax=Bactrocera latifrons TaxID=174628 RepID=A0A0K8WDN7_BACLA
MKSYSQSGLTQHQQQYNYRLSRDKRFVEHAFEIISSRFRILLTGIHLPPEKATKIVLVICYLHNFLSTKSSEYYLRMINDVGEKSVPALMQIEKKNHKSEEYYQRQGNSKLIL